MKLLLIEDDKSVADFIMRGLKEHGHVADHATDGKDGLFLAASGKYDALIVDRMLPGLDGLSIMKMLRATGNHVPALFLTTMGGIDDRVEGLEAGADDYLVKPFALDELAARLRALLRRTATRGEASVVLRVGRLSVDPSAVTATFDGRPLSLTVREFAVLEYLARRSPAVASPEELLEHVWDEHCNPFTNTIRVHLANLRRKLREVSGDNVIETVVGKGYRLCAR